MHALMLLFLNASSLNIWPSSARGSRQ